MADPKPPVDDRSAMEIVAALGKSMERVKVPRNALDVLGMPDEAETKVTNAARPEILSEPPPRSPMRRGLIQGASPPPVTDSAEHDVPEVGQDDDVLAEFGEEADLGDNLSPELDHSMMPAP
jgi:hypothetical protein